MAPKQQRKRQKKAKRNYAKNEKYPALNPKRQVFNRRDSIDGDYYDKLSEKEREWMNAFLSETVVTNFNHTGPDFYTTKEEKRKLFAENNARNRCALNHAKSKNLMNNIGEVTHVIEVPEHETASSIEDAFILAIDTKYDPDLLDRLNDAPEDTNNKRQRRKKANDNSR